MLTFIEDMGMHYPTESSNTKRRMYKVLCSDCDKPNIIQAGQFKAGYTTCCKSCSNIKLKGKRK